jgi:DNA-3-methyladenine glycosylase I
MSNAGIIRNRAKINASIVNARAFLRVAEEWSTFDGYIWNFVDGAPVVNAWTELSQLPATTPLSDLISRDLRRRGFSFVGSTVVYAHMQATGMVNDHLTSCFRYHEVMS